ncbi:hypothetical protein KGD82_07625 [Nocardiopsis eucommiae]|uniref:Sodium:glutamate symporter n=1 Tax=Nocardiopsis eucommiae TaxID=2831970 RepID=A0A975QK74_9ACTN|nr:hypothetical protein KGD82_07625 [Nocardiopsis eucommiae]
MPELIEFDSNALNSLLLSGVSLGVFLLLGLLVRALVPLTRRLFLPAALIGGFLGLVCGQYVLDIVPAGMSATWSSLAGVLIAVVFAPMLLGQRLPPFREAAREAGAQIWMSYFSTFVQVAVPALLVFAVLGPLFGTDPLLSTIFEASWSGGHGTAAGMDETWTALGWPDGTPLALFAATVGLVYGVVMGTVLLNIAAKRGHLSHEATARQVEQADILEEADQNQATTGRLHASALSNLAFHGSLIALAILIGSLFKHVIDQVVSGVPLFPWR